jgi:hypothetical protein
MQESGCYSVGTDVLAQSNTGSTPVRAATMKQRPLDWLATGAARFPYNREL